MMSEIQMHNLVQLRNLIESAKSTIDHYTCYLEIIKKAHTLLSCEMNLGKSYWQQIYSVV